MPVVGVSRRENSLLVPAMIVLGLFLLVPLIVSLVLSGTSFSLLGNKTNFVGLKNYQSLLVGSVKPGGFLSDVFITLRFTVVSVTIETVLGFAIAGYLSRRFFLTGWLRTLMTVPLMIAPVVSGLQWKYLFDPQVGLVNFLLQTFHIVGQPQNWFSNTHTAWILIVVADVWQTTGFMTLFILAGLQSLPSDVFEAASIDGASGWLRFWRIRLPLVWPVLAAAVVLRTMDAFRIFDIAYVLTDGGPLYSSETVSLFTYRVGLSNFNMALASASSLLILICVILISMPLMRSLMESSS